MKRRFLAVMISAGLIMSLGGCGYTIMKAVVKHLKSDSSDSSSSVKYSKDFTFTGKIVRVTNEKGSFFGIVGDDGSQYDPCVSLDPACQVDGQRVKVKAKLAKNAVSPHGWGSVIKVRRVKVIKEKTVHST